MFRRLWELFFLLVFGAVALDFAVNTVEAHVKVIVIVGFAATATIVYFRWRRHNW